MHVQEAQALVEQLWGPFTAVDYEPGVPSWDTRYRVYHKGEIYGWGHSYESAIANAKLRHPPQVSA